MNIENLEKKEINYLKTLGFEDECFDDNSGCWFVKKINHNILGHIQITIDEGKDGYVMSLDNNDELNYLVTIFEKKYSRENLKELLKFLS